MSDRSAQLLAQREALRAQLAEIDAELGEASSKHDVSELASLLDEIEVGIWSFSARTQRTLYVNRALILLTGRPREAFPLENGSLMAWLHPDDQESAKKVRQQVFETGTGNFLGRLIRAHGEERWCRFRAHVVFDARGEPERVDLLVLDVHDQYVAEKDLRTTKRRLERILEQNWDVLWTSGPERQLNILGGAQREVGGVPIEVLFGHSAIDYRHPDDMNELNARWAAVVGAPGSTHKAELRIRARNGEYIWMEKVVTNLLDDPDVRALVGATRDIDARKRAEIALVEANAELEQRIAVATMKLQETNSRLMQAVRAKDTFLANMSHELRTPLNGVLGFAEALQAHVYGPLSDKQRHAVQRIEQSGRHLLSLIEDILDLAKIEAGKAEIELAPVVLTNVCQASLAMIEGAARSKNINVSLQMSDHFASFWADERKLKQILVNLLGNAVKFTPKGGLVGLEVKVAAEHNTIVFCVWDKGIGISPADIHRMFEPFVQLDSSLARVHSGTGLGLPLVRSLVDLHGGSVSAESEIGQGTRFYVQLPMQRRGESRPSKSAPHALIVEDSEPMSEQLQRYLHDMGIDSVICREAANVVEYAATEQPALILLDILLPAPVGWDVLSELQNASRTAQIPVIVISVLGERDKALSLGAIDCLQKPIERERLQAAVKRASAQTLKRTTLIASVPAAAPVVEPKRILIAEDDELNVLTMLDFLRMEGYEVYVARDGREAVELARELRPAIILMDIQMPRMDGLAAIQELKADPSDEVRRIPIIALTALAMKSDRERCLKAGAEEYLAKPASLQQLAAYLRKYTAVKPPGA